MIKKDNNAIQTNDGADKNRIKISDFYTGDCLEQEYVEVSDVVLTYLTDKKREENKIEMRDYRYLAAFGLEEEKVAKICVKYEQSTEEKYYENLRTTELYEAMDKLKPVCRKRFYLYYAVGLTMKQIAELEGVDHSTVQKSLKSTALKLRELLCNGDNFEI